ncbi:uracil-DNA glycosylase [Leptotrichia sp. OH3620_COT-345]|uniref:uracil-DNA glycosylase n=1 Tax=Leptotrichia sp. OH3620_COT-345 TaxID=2491048 RepID=UPI000F652021|nr:uracil-DNA glycosylase [Leptotrichia sp. OH3620_COT-345]RRD39544.1 uracil-DNA glycosylase [Leptotrichia sp. OH3620_COT-345]
MNIILDDIINYKNIIKDFGVDPVNKRFITTGDKLVFFKNGVIEKEIAGKIKNSEIIKYIREKNQLFVSSIFFVSTQNGKIFKCDSIKKKIVESVFDFEKPIEFINFTKGGKVVYIENNILYSYDPNSKELISEVILTEEEKHKGNYKIFTSGENIILKYRELHSQTNIINIFDSKLEKIFDIKTENNHIYSKIVDLEYIAGTATGEIEIWNILEKELYNSLKISDTKISYIERSNENYFIGTGNGDLIITDSEFKVLKVQNIFKSEIRKICVIEDGIFVLGTDNRIVTLKITGNKNEKSEILFREKFLKKHNIHKDYYDFFTFEKIVKIHNFLKQMEIQKVNYIPKEENIFKIFSDSLYSRKVCLIGKEIYFQYSESSENDSEKEKSSWDDPEISTSLKNILKLIYKTYMGKSIDINNIKEKILSGNFKIFSPDKLIKSWKEQGVLFLSRALTVIDGKSGEYSKFWIPFIKELCRYISLHNKDMVYFLWGKDTEIFEKDIISGEIIKHGSPAVSGNIGNEKDFLNSKCFEKTKKIINWTGFEISEVKENIKSEKDDFRLF